MNYPYSLVVFGYVKIYTLSDKQGNVFYVGATSQAVAARLRAHLAEAKSANRKNVNVPKCDLIQSLDYEITITVVDSVFTSGRRVSELVYLRRNLEAKWISKYRELGYHLTNKIDNKKERALKSEPIGFSVDAKELMGQQN